MIARFMMRVLMALAAIGFLVSVGVHIISLIGPELRSQILYYGLFGGLLVLLIPVLVIQMTDPDLRDTLINQASYGVFGKAGALIRNAPDITKKLLLVLFVYSFASAVWIYFQYHWQIPAFFDYGLRWPSPGWMLLYGYVGLVFYSRLRDMEPRAGQDNQSLL